MGGQPYDQVSSPSVVLVNGSPQSLQQDIMSGAIAWHVPAGILMMIATVGATVAVGTLSSWLPLSRSPLTQAHVSSEAVHCPGRGPHRGIRP